MRRGGGKQPAWKVNSWLWTGVTAESRPFLENVVSILNQGAASLTPFPWWNYEVIQAARTQTIQEFILELIRKSTNYLPCEIKQICSASNLSSEPRRNVPFFKTTFCKTNLGLGKDVLFSTNKI